jgi:hypothetical protein
MYGLPFFIYGAVQVLTCLPDLDVNLVYTKRRATHLQMLTHAFIVLRGIFLDPTKNGRVIHIEVALTHHLFDIAIG